MGRKPKLSRTGIPQDVGHRWEQAASAAASSSWEAPATRAEGEEPTPSDPDYRAFCGRQLYQMLDALKGSALSAKQASLLAHWATGAGAQGVEDLACRPGQQTGKSSRHWDLATARGKPTDDVFYEIEVPIQTRYDATTSEVLTPIVPAHVALADEWNASRTEVERKLTAAVENGSLGEVYTSHPVVQSKWPG